MKIKGYENDNSTVLLDEEEQDTAEYLTGHEMLSELFYGTLCICLTVVVFIIICAYAAPVR